MLSIGENRGGGVEGDGGGGEEDGGVQGNGDSEEDGGGDHWNKDGVVRRVEVGIIEGTWR